MKKIIFLLLCTVSFYGQTLQNPTYGTVTVKNSASDTTPAYFVTSQTDGVYKKTPAATVEKTANKQNSLATDGTGTKYPTVDAVNAGLNLKANIGNAFTAGRVPYTSSTSAISDSSRLLWNNTNSSLEVNGNAPRITLKNNLNNYSTYFTNNAGGGLFLKNHQDKTLALFTNPVGSTEQPQMAIGNVSSIPNEAQLYVYGGVNGANIDARGSVTTDEANIDLEGNDWETAPNSLGFSYFGSNATSFGTVLGYAKNKLGAIRFQDTNYAIINSDKSTGVSPIRFGINQIEIGNVNDKGFSYQSNFSSENISNPRWLTDKAYVDTKEPIIPTGTALQYIKGDKTLGTFPTIPTVDQTIIDGSTNAVSGNAVFDGLALKANLASPTLTGTPTAPTAAPGATGNQIATVDYVRANKQNSLAIDGTGTKYPTVDAVNAGVVKLTGNQSIAGDKTIKDAIILEQGADFQFQNSTFKTSFNSNTLTADRGINLPDKDGVVALTSDLHNALTLGTANGLSLATQVLSLGLAGASANGALSSTDWNTFNGKLSGTGTTNYLPKFTSANVLGNSQIFDNGARVCIGGTDNGVDKLQVIGSAFISSNLTIGDYPINGLRIQADGRVISKQGTFEFAQGGNAYDDGYIGYLESYYSERTGLLRFQGSIANEGYIISGEQHGSETALWAKNTEVARLKSNGNFLIGTTTDNVVDKLQVNGSISASPATTSSQVVVKSQLDAKADLASPTLTGTPTAPTAPVGTNTTQIATTAFVQNIVSSGTFTPSSTGGITFKRCYWVKTGNVLDVVYNFSITGATSYTATMTLPNSFTINSNSNGIDIGGGKVTTNSGYSRLQETATSSDVYLSITSENTGTASGFARASILIN